MDPRMAFGLNKYKALLTDNQKIRLNKIEKMMILLHPFTAFNGCQFSRISNLNSILGRFMEKN